MKAKDKLRAYWSKQEKDLMVYSPLGICTKNDGGYLASRLWDIVKELENRGYDPTSVKFSIEPKKGNERFASQRVGTDNQ